MRYWVAAIVLALATPATAVELDCSISSAGAFCFHPKADLPYGEVHLDRPGAWEATVKFANALADAIWIDGLQIGHWDEYDPAGKLVNGNTAGGTDLINVEIPAGLTGFSFRYSTPGITQSAYSDPYFGPLDVFVGTETRFEIGSLAALPGFTMSIERLAAVPEPASWAMMIAGFGMVGAMVRRRRYSMAQM